MVSSRWSRLAPRGKGTSSAALPNVRAGGVRRGSAMPTPQCQSKRSTSGPPDVRAVGGAVHLGVSSERRMRGRGLVPRGFAAPLATCCARRHPGAGRAPSCPSRPALHCLTPALLHVSVMLSVMPWTGEGVAVKATVRQTDRQGKVCSEAHGRGTAHMWAAVAL